MKLIETDYKGRCPRCASKDHFMIISNKIKCKHCDFSVGAVLSDNIDVTILPTWEDFYRWRNTVFKEKDKR